MKASKGFFEKQRDGQTQGETEPRLEMGWIKRFEWGRIYRGRKWTGIVACDGIEKVGTINLASFGGGM